MLGSFNSQFEGLNLEKCYVRMGPMGLMGTMGTMGAMGHMGP